MQDSLATPRPRFSLGKILIVTAVVAGAGMLGLVVVATLFVPKVLAKVSDAQRGKAQVDLTAIRRAVEEYAARNGGEWPESLEVLVIQDANGHRYLASPSVPRDPWGREYLYEPPRGPGDEPVLQSLGADGKPGGEGRNADIISGTRLRSR